MKNRSILVRAGIRCVQKRRGAYHWSSQRDSPLQRALDDAAKLPFAELHEELLQLAKLIDVLRRTGATAIADAFVIALRAHKRCVERFVLEEKRALDLRPNALPIRAPHIADRAPATGARLSTFLRPGEVDRRRARAQTPRKLDP